MSTWVLTAKSPRSRLRVFPVRSIIVSSSSLFYCVPPFYYSSRRSCSTSHQLCSAYHRSSFTRPTLVLTEPKSDRTIIRGSGLTGKDLSVTSTGPQPVHKVVIEDLLKLMCREYARCLRTLLQAPVEHQCVTVGSKEIVQSHVEVMAMQLQRELFFFPLLLFFSSATCRSPRDRECPVILSWPLCCRTQNCQTRANYCITDDSFPGCAFSRRHRLEGVQLDEPSHDLAHAHTLASKFP